MSKRQAYTDDEDVGRKSENVRDTKSLLFISLAAPLSPPLLHFLLYLHSSAAINNVDHESD